MVSSLQHPGQSEQWYSHQDDVSDNEFAVRAGHSRPRFVELGVGVGEAKSQARLPQYDLATVLWRPEKNNVQN